jgi:hypothetical protein
MRERVCHELEEVTNDGRQKGLFNSGSGQKGVVCTIRRAWFESMKNQGQGSNWREK